MQSHTILGSRSQRGLTQLSLDTLFKHTEPYLADVESHSTTYPSLCAADVSEAHLLPASHFLDSFYGDGMASRAATPAMVRDSKLPSHQIPGAFPEPPPSQRESMQVFDRLYPSLAKYQTSQHVGQPSTTVKSPSKSLVHSTFNVSRLTTSAQEASFLSAQGGSKKYAPRISMLPQSPGIDDISIDVDSDAEYAIVVSMYEVYNDRIFDLLTASASNSKAPQKRRALLFKNTERSQDRKVVAGLRKVVCSSLDEALLVLETGLHERRVAGTNNNAVSSRSHGFFCVEVKKRHRGSIPGPWSSSTMTIVDLAGRFDMKSKSRECY